MPIKNSTSHRSYASLAKAIRAIGQEVVTCDKGCLGAAKRADGVIPRCLYLQPPSPEAKGMSFDAAPGAIVVGLNPGPAKDHEKKLYLAHLDDPIRLYAKTEEYLEKLFLSAGYYEKTHGFVRSLCRALNGESWSGPLLWTEIAKCELAAGQKHVLTEMATTCSRRFLSREMAAVPQDWPVFAIGRKAFEAACFLGPQRAVIGVPHTTGAWGGAFHKLCVDSAKGEMDAKKKVKNLVRKVVTARGVTWLPDHNLT